MGSFHIGHKWWVAREGVAHNDLWHWPISFRSFCYDCNKTAKIWHILPCPLCSMYSSEWVLSLSGTNDHWHLEGVSFLQWLLTLTFIFKVIQPWLCNKTAKIGLSILIREIAPCNKVMWSLVGTMFNSKGTRLVDRNYLTFISLDCHLPNNGIPSKCILTALF